MVLNVLARNCDDHTKNFSFRLKKGANWELAPAYDVCHAYKPGHRWVSQHALSINGKRTAITREDLLIIGKSINNKKAAVIIDEISDIVSQWKKFADAVNVLPEIRDEIDKTLIKWK
jgi:serine/threonine-protein kinase HipA